MDVSKFGARARDIYPCFSATISRTLCRQHSATLGGGILRLTRANLKLMKALSKAMLAKFACTRLIWRPLFRLFDLSAIASQFESFVLSRRIVIWGNFKPGFPPKEFVFDGEHINRPDKEQNAQYLTSSLLFFALSSLITYDGCRYAHQQALSRLWKNHCNVVWPLPECLVLFSRPPPLGMI